MKTAQPSNVRNQFLKPFSLLINVTFTISFVSLHIHSEHLPISHCHSAHLSFTLIISTRSGCIRKCTFCGEKGLFSSLLRSFQRSHPRLESCRPCTESQPAVHPARAISYPLRMIFLATPTVWPYRKDATRRTTKNPLSRRLWNVAKRKRFPLGDDLGNQTR